MLRADRSLWWPARRMLFIADLHAGKIEHFQLAGAALPVGSTEADLARLSRSIVDLQPERVVVLGDLFHSDINDGWHIVRDWVRRQPCPIELVRGNHDRFIDDATFLAGGLQICAEDTIVGPFRLRHHPIDYSQTPVLCGHVHPVHTFGAGGIDALRMPCFVVQPQQLILPAYGSFTGGFAMSAAAGQLVGTGDDFTSLLVLPAM